MTALRDHEVLAAASSHGGYPRAAVAEINAYAKNGHASKPLSSATRSFLIAHVDRVRANLPMAARHSASSDSDLVLVSFFLRVPDPAVEAAELLARAAGGSQ